MKVNLLCHVERLPKYEEDPDQVYFSLNLTAAIGDPEVPGGFDGKVVSPWKWTTKKIHVYLEKDSKLVDLTPLTIDPLGSKSGNDKFFKQLDGVLADFLKKAETDKTLFTWVADKTETLTRDAEKARWHEFLIHASTFPADLTHEANLAFVFKVPKAKIDTADRIIAAPEIDFGGGLRKPIDETEPKLDIATKLHYVQVGSTDAAKEPFFYEWLYDGTNPDVAAYQRECVLAAKSEGDQFLELASGWVMPKGGDTATEDWSLSFERRAAEAFDLPLRILEAIGDKELADQAQRDAVVNAVFGVFHDIAGIGIRDSAPGRVVQLFAPEVLSELAKEIPAGALDALRAYDKALTSATWQELLERVVGTGLFKSSDGVPLIAHKDVMRELQRMHGLLTTENVLRELVIAQWEEAFKANDALKSFLDGNKDRMRREVLPRFNLRKTFLLEALQEIWHEFSDFTTAATPQQQLDEIRKKLSEKLLHYFRQRFDLTSAGKAYTTFEPRTAAPTDFVAVIQAGLDDYVNRFTASTKNNLIRTDATNERDALVVQIADVVRSKEDAGSKEDQHESSRRISGYGVLMKRGAGDWTCLSLAQVVHPVTRAALTDKAVSVPLRLGYRNGLRQTFFTYENQPLVAEAPMQRALKTSLQEKSKLDAQSFFAYANPYGVLDKKLLLCPLIYGENYDVAAFVLGNAGVLPNGLQEPMKPWNLRELKDAKPPNGAVRKLPYRRRTLVGMPRVRPEKASKDAFETLTLIPIPSTVLPIARSIARPSDEPEGAASSRPLLLLRPNHGTFKQYEFMLYTPTVDLNVWDRWVSIDATKEMLKKRIDLIGTYHKKADEQGATMNEDQKRVDISLEDPAVTSWVFRLTQRFDGVKATSVVKQIEKLVIKPSAVTEPLDAARTKPVKVTVNIGAPKITLVSETEVAVTVPQKEVFMLEIHPAVTSMDMKRFASDVKTFGTEGDLTLFHPLAIDVEVVPETLVFDPEKLHNALVVEPEGIRAGGNKDRDEIVVRLDSDKLGDDIKPWIHRVEAVLQQWRWSGRPIARPKMTGNTFDLTDGYDFATDPGPNDDAVLFADRSNLDALVVPHLVDFADPDAARVAELHRRDLRRTPGALYFRVALRCVSRYEGILDVDGDSRRGATPERWQRKVVKSTWTGPAPQPVIKLIVPLTRPLGDDVTPPLLVVLDEPWGDAGGLAEELVTEIVDVEVAYADGTQKRAELGRDPILSLMKVDPTPKSQAPIGPIGYTFDTDTDAPLFVKSSFLLPPPKIDGVADLSWFFVKMQFKRRLRPAGTVDNMDHVSASTQPVWCQYLPPSTSFETVDDKSVAVASLKINNSGKVPQLVDARGNAVRLRATKKGIVDTTSRCIFDLYVLITEPVTDAAGRPDQEAFVNVYRIDANGLLVDGANIDLTGRTLRARVIEVQGRKLPNPDLWSSLFTAENIDAESRIVRISPPF